MIHRVPSEAEGWVDIRETIAILSGFLHNTTLADMKGDGKGLLWNALVDNAKLKEVSSREPRFIVLGSEGSGKTTIISSLMNKARPDKVEPTIGLDYKYLRNNSSLNGAPGAKSISHFWEFGGGRNMSPALPAIIKQKSIVLVVVDMSQPSSIVTDLSYWLPLVKAAAQCNQVRQYQMMIIANKYDLASSANLEIICRTLRAIAHNYGAGLISHSIENRNLQQLLRSVLSRFLSEKPNEKRGGEDIEHTKALMIMPSMDSIESIGTPNGRLVAAADHCQTWCQAYRNVFPDQPVKPPIDYSELDLEPEPVVDAMWIQKREELKRSEITIKPNPF